MLIKLYEHPFVVCEPRVFEVSSLAEWLFSHYGESPTVGVQIYLGEPSAENEITGNVKAILAATGDCTILQSPGADPVSWYAILTNIAITYAVNYAINQIFFRPGGGGGAGGLENRGGSSPNNSLGQRDNRVRVLERVEDIYGTVKSVPSLMMPTYQKYINHEQVEYGYYCVGRGYYDIAEVRDGETLISDVLGSSAAVYAPFTSPNYGTAQLQIGDAIVDQIVAARRSVEIDGITLKAQNQIQLSSPAEYTFWPAGTGDTMTVPVSAYDIISQAVRHPNFNSIAEAGDTVTYATITKVATSTCYVVAATNTYTDGSSVGPLFVNLTVGSIVTFAGFVNSANNGTFTVVTKPSVDVITVTGAGHVDEGTSGITATTSITGATRTIRSIGDGYIELTTATFTAKITDTANAMSIGNGVSDWSSWITLATTDRSKLWVNIVAQQGIYKDSGSKSSGSVAYTMEVEQLDSALVPTGTVETVSSTLVGRGSDPRAETLEHTTAWTGPARVRIRRTTAFDYAFSGLVVDEIKWADLYSVTAISNNDFGNKTTIHTITKATPRATAARARQLNCIASRKLPTYNGTTFSGAFDGTGLLVSGTISATNRISDIIPAVAIDPIMGARPITEVDVNQIYAVQQLLDAWTTEAGQFNYTFDNAMVSFEEILTTIANAAFCTAYRQGGQIRLSFDRAQTASTALFTHRNKKPDAETITRTFANAGGYDGIEFSYVDPDSNQPETIKLPLDHSATKYRRVEYAGIRSYDQAWLRANRDYRKLIGQRLVIETEVTGDGRLVIPGARVDIVDNTRFKTFDGEVVGQSGLTIRLSRPVTFTTGTHSVLLKKRDGSVESIVVTAGANDREVVLQSAPAETIVTDPTPDAGVRTEFSFASDSARLAQAWIVQEISRSGGEYVKLIANNYSESYYSQDNAAIPAKATVIT